MTAEFFKVADIGSVLEMKTGFGQVPIESAPLTEALGRVLAAEIMADSDIPGFDRATMDGYAVAAASTFGASEANPAYLTVVGSIRMGQPADVRLETGQTARIATGGMLPPGADSVVMVEHTEALDQETIEVYRSVAPGQHVVAADDDAARGQVLLLPGVCLRPQEIGVLAACGRALAPVFRRPRIGIISTGDEVVPIEEQPGPGRIRDVNTYTLAGLVRAAGAEPVLFGIVADRFEELLACCRRALAETDMVLVSGGSSVGTRDLTVEVLAAMPESRILVHGVAISPGKPTILARCGNKAFWGLPGHVTSAMVVFLVLVRPFIHYIGGRTESAPLSVRARLSRNLASAQGRVDYIRVRLARREGELWAEPVLGASGLIRTMAEAHGLVAVDRNSEGLDKDTIVDVILM